MKSKSVKIRNTVFFLVLLLFVMLCIWIIMGGKRRAVWLPFPVVAILAIAFGILGVVLVVMTVRLDETRRRRIFFILTGVSAAGIPLSAILHNLVYGLFIILFGKGFWGGQGGRGGDEPVFFILAIFVFPALFLIGTIGSIVLLIKTHMAGKDNNSKPENSSNSDDPS